jgi:hypothetical protein
MDSSLNDPASVMNHAKPQNRALCSTHNALFYFGIG